MIEHSDTITKLMGAMLAVQGAVDGVAKDSKNPAFRSSYASLESVVETIRPHCQKHGLVVMQAPGALGVHEDKHLIGIETLIVHAESGEWIKSAMEVPLTKTDAQGAGSAITYGERYSLMAMFNLPPVDDDGESASTRSSSPPSSISQQATAAARRAPAPAVKPIPDDPRFMTGDPASVRKRMIDAVSTASVTALPKLVSQSSWLESMEKLPEDDKIAIDNAIADRRAILSDMSMAG